MNVVWLLQDLRIHDNPALFEALQSSAQTTVIYILDDSYAWSVGDAQRWWLHHSLVALEQALNKKNIPLLLLRGDYGDVLNALFKAQPFEHLYANTVFHPNILKRQAQCERWAKQNGIQCHWMVGNHLYHPSTPLNGQGTEYKVFTQYWKQARKTLSERELYAAPKKQKTVFECSLQGESLEEWDLLPKRPNWAKGFESLWTPGELGAKKRLTHFVESGIGSYHDDRDRPDKSGVSGLSPHLHFGEISPWQIWHKVQQAIQEEPVIRHGADTFLKQLGWREFSHHLLYHYHDLPVNNFNKKFDSFKWEKNTKALKAWQKGQTGYPIVDAGMRELWHTGYMHNRVRMIVGSFLTKDLFIHWREGEKWFWHTLLDADLANNAASWQWVAGTGADAAPYFRIFNPTLQGKKFDPDGIYVRKWVPEIAHLPKNQIHEPWLADVPPKDYPSPIVDHAKARDKALALYQNVKK